jgi:hypothetical protein
MGLIRYSRQYIDIYVKAVEDALREQGVHIPQEPAIQTARRATG